MKNTLSLVMILLVSSSISAGSRDELPGNTDEVYESLIRRIDRLLPSLPPAQTDAIKRHAERLKEAEQKYESRRERALSEHEERRRRALEGFGSTAEAENQPPAAAPPVEPPSGESAQPVEGIDIPTEPDVAPPTPAPPVGAPIDLTPAQASALVSEGIERFGRALEQASRKHNLRSSFLLCVMKIESAFKIDAESHAGARGLMQLMPTTAEELGVNPYDLSENIAGGAKLIDRLLRQYSEDTTLAMAAYNAGPGAVTRYGGVPPYEETLKYVERIDRECGSPR